MRIIVATLLIAAPTAARADDGDCTGADSNTEQCSALWPNRDGRAPASLSVGWASDAFDPAGKTFSEHATGYANQLGQFQATGLGPMRGNGFFVDARFHPTTYLYAGVDLSAAWGDPPAAQFMLRSTEVVAWDSATLFTMAATAGARLPLGRFSLRGELVAGLHGASLSAMSGTSSLQADALAALVEPRIAIDAWLSPWWVVEAYAGINALDTSERVFGVGLGVHLQAFDGAYR
ncbi:MAG TPA: hypothetical protein VGL61_07355 [Kofleriaceae bacterium]|jgi:hypothetical protein